MKKKLKINRLTLWILLGMGLLLIACGPEEDRFNSTEERTIRRMVRKQQDSIKMKQDSLCEAEIKARLDIMVDSLLEIKVEELKTKMGKR